MVSCSVAAGGGEGLSRESGEGWRWWGWQGMGIELPEEWNLVRHVGHGGKGGVVFGDLRAVRLVVRWTRVGRWGKGPAVVERMAGRLRQRGAGVEELGGGLMGVKVRDRPGRLLLVADARRLYEVEMMGDENGVAERIGRGFQRRLGGERWWWSAYGAEGETGAWARLARAVMQPGRTELRLQGVGGERGTMWRFGANGMGEELLKRHGTLRRWAEMTFAFAGNAGSWEEGADRARWVRRADRTWGRAARVEALTLRHDRGANRICWTHVCEPAKT